MMTASPFTRAFLLMFSGPLIWSVHFLAVYIVAALACARGLARVDPSGAGILQWTTAILTLAGLAVLAAVILRQRHQATNFHQWMTITLCALSALGMLWVAAPVYLVPACK